MITEHSYAEKEEIEEKKIRIQTIITKSNATQSELAEARKLIASLNTDIEGYKQQVEVLQGEKIQLTQEKEFVTKQRDRARKDLDSAETVIKTKDDLIDVGSTLHVSNFNIVGVNEKGSSKEKPTTKAKKVDKLRITFDLDENRITSSGTKELYVIITSPDGSPIAVEALGSGTFVTREGESKPYTKKLNVEYIKSQKKTVSFDWKQNNNFQTGNYKIEVFNNGFKVGEAYRPLKKGGLFS